MSNQVRHAVSDPLMPGYAPYPIPDSEFGNSESGTRWPRAWSMERYRIFHPYSTFSRLTLGHGVVGFHPT